MNRKLQLLDTPSRNRKRSLPLDYKRVHSCRIGSLFLTHSIITTIIRKYMLTSMQKKACILVFITQLKVMSVSGSFLWLTMHAVFLPSFNDENQIQHKYEKTTQAPDGSSRNLITGSGCQLQKVSR